MGRRRRDERRRAVEAQRRRRAVTRPPRGARASARPGDRGRAAPEIGAFLEGIVADLDDELEEEDELVEDEADDEEFEDLELLRERVRVVLAATVEEHDGEVARALVTDLVRSSTDRVLVDLLVGAWLAKVLRRRTEEDLRRRAVAWVAEVLGERGPVVEDAARVVGPSIAEVVRETFLRTPDDVLVARIWLLAAVLALAPADDAVRVDVIHES